jgi:hypothetical protein
MLFDFIVKTKDHVQNDFEVGWVSAWFWCTVGAIKLFWFNTYSESIQYAQIKVQARLVWSVSKNLQVEPKRQVL